MSPILDLTPGGDSIRPWETVTKGANLVLLEMLPTSVPEMRIRCGSRSQTAHVSSGTGLFLVASVHCRQYLLLPATCKDGTMECLGFRSTEWTLGQIFSASELFKKWRGEEIKMGEKLVSDTGYTAGHHQRRLEPSPTEELKGLMSPHTQDVPTQREGPLDEGYHRGCYGNTEE